MPDYEVIEAYDFMLPIMFERFSSPMTLQFVIPKENDGFLGTIQQRMKALRPALDMVRERRKLLNNKRAYETDLARTVDWGSSSVEMSQEFWDTLAKGIEGQRKPLREKLGRIDAEIKQLEDDTRHKIRLALIEETK
jgi:hypothetical protein